MPCNDSTESIIHDILSHLFSMDTYRACRLIKCQTDPKLGRKVRLNYVRDVTLEENRFQSETSTILDLARDGFDIKPPLYHSFVAECTDNPGVLVGYALYYYAFRASTGRKIFLEDIWVTENHRGCGVGSALIRKVMEQGVEANCISIDYLVLDWNPAKNFYLKLGACDVTTTRGLRAFRIKRSDMVAWCHGNRPRM